MGMETELLTVRDWPNRNRLSTLVSFGSLNTILTLSGSSAGGSGGRHSDFLSFSSSSVWRQCGLEIGGTARVQSSFKNRNPNDSLFVWFPLQEHFVGPSPPLASVAPSPPVSFAPSPDRHARRRDRPRPAAASELGSGSSLLWNKNVWSPAKGCIWKSRFPDKWCSEVSALGDKAGK